MGTNLLLCDDFLLRSCSSLELTYRNNLLHLNLQEGIRPMRKRSFVETTFNSFFQEIVQSSGIQFAIAYKKEGKIVQATKFFKCRDFLSDAYLSVKTGKPGIIYGFSYDPTKDFLKRRLLLLLKIGKTAPNKTVSAMMSLLRDVEKKLSIKKTFCYRTQKEKIFLLSAPKFWRENTIKLSMFTFILRQGHHIVVHKIEPNADKIFSGETYNLYRKHSISDALILGSFNSLDKVKSLLVDKVVQRRIRKFVSNTDPQVSSQLRTFHNNSGIMSAVNGNMRIAMERRGL